MTSIKHYNTHFGYGESGRYTLHVINGVPYEVNRYIGYQLSSIEPRKVKLGSIRIVDSMIFKCVKSKAVGPFTFKYKTNWCYVHNNPDKDYIPGNILDKVVDSFTKN